MTLEAVKAEKRLAKMALVVNSRLSVQPVTDEEWRVVLALARPWAEAAEDRDLRPKDMSARLEARRSDRHIAPIIARAWKRRAREKAMSEKVYGVPAQWAERACIDDARYQEMYQRSIRDPDAFWGEHGKRIDWIKPYTKVRDISWDSHHVSIKWYEDGETNVAYNCIDRHLPKRADQVAIIWEGDRPDESKRITYAELHEQVCRFANVLKSHGVGKAIGSRSICR